ncbi:MAG: SRPBCC domain-containing protein [Saprospiraceae bacterium]
MKNEPFIIESTYPAPAGKVWNAITDKDEMKQWYFKLAEFEPEVGFEFRFDGGPEDRDYHHVCKITEVIPGIKLEHTWSYEGYEGMSYVAWELFPEGTNNTRVRLTHAGLETFPKENADFARNNFEQGWAGILGTSLRDYLAK